MELMAQWVESFFFFSRSVALLVMDRAWSFGGSTASRCLTSLEFLLGTVVHYLLRKVFPIIYPEKSNRKVTT